MDNTKMTIEELKAFVKLEAQKLIKEGKEITDEGDPVTDVEMNSMDRVDNSDGSAYVKAKDGGGYEKKTGGNVEGTEEATDVDMNKQDSDQGHDEEIAAATKVDAKSSTKSGPSIEGMHDSDFESKKANPSKESGDPFTDDKEVKMNSQDKEMDEGTKTYVDAGGDITGREPHTTGQKKAVPSEKAKNEKETYERIAKGIELPEGTVFKNKKSLLEFIETEAKKASKLL